MAALVLSAVLSSLSIYAVTAVFALPMLAMRLLSYSVSL